jgi:hypothetical protein
VLVSVLTVCARVGTAGYGGLLQPAGCVVDGHVLHRRVVEEHVQSDRHRRREVIVDRNEAVWTATLHDIVVVVNNS